MIVIKILFYNINVFKEAQKTLYFIDLQDNHFTEQHRTLGKICANA